MLSSNHIQIKAVWDEDVKTWSATSEDVVGLFVEASNLDDLPMRIINTYLDLLAVANLPLPAAEIVFKVVCIKGESTAPKYDLNVYHSQEVAAVTC